MLRVAIFLILLLGSCGYALLRGGAPERIAAAAMLAAVAASALFRSEVDSLFIEVEVGILLIDTALLAVLIAVALRADRGWPLLVAALHLSTVGAHAVKLIDPDMIRVTYALMITVWSYPMVIALAIGTRRHHIRLRAQGHDLDWSLPIARNQRASALPPELRWWTRP